jgi:hypothetical protein
MSKISLIDQPKKLLELINDCLKPKETEKKQFGEVFTPMKLVNEMLDKLPPEVWKNKNLTWYDPANGMGNFPIAVYLRLMESLKEEIIDEKERKKHILEKMLYMSELNKKNCLICSQIFDINGEYKLNLYNGDSLSLDVKKQWNIDKFDIIMGNPPYQEAKATGDNKLYLLFIRSALENLKQNCFLLMITPINVKNYLTNKEKNRRYIKEFYDIIFLSLNVSNKYFKNIGIYFSVFLLKKTVVIHTNTLVEFVRKGIIEKDTIEIKKGYNIPLCLSKIDIQIINKVSNIIENKNKLFNIKKAEYLINGKKTLQRIRKSHITTKKILSKEEENFRYKIIDKINKNNPFPGIFYFNDNTMIDYGKSKIIMCTGGYLMPEFDKNGEYNLSDNMIYMLCNSENLYRSFKILINSKLVKYLNKITMTDNIHGRDFVIMNLKMIDLSKIQTEDDIRKLYFITDKEMEIIDKTQ